MSDTKHEFIEGEATSTTRALEQEKKAGATPASELRVYGLRDEFKGTVPEGPYEIWFNGQKCVKKTIGEETAYFLDGLTEGRMREFLEGSEK